MDAYYYCAEHAHVTRNGAIKFSLKIVKLFIAKYTPLCYADFTPSMIERLRIVMIDYYNMGVNGIMYDKGQTEKIELPKFIFE